MQLQDYNIFIHHIHDYTEYNQQWNVCSVRAATEEKNKTKLVMILKYTGNKSIF